eukprot:CAMPEP_0119470892 /NCGR_PEP_ID=MMETSP1344-20130328/3601_1 /TAXON_ID=236787 /ORGANISM="Florenciella parvula, Strain CCMP2471" /LENGTH=44 /DNA_ID= /DNA_START= /DNA_END= /DNA_ORIENTATION=
MGAVTPGISSSMRLSMVSSRRRSQGWHAPRSSSSRKKEPGTSEA